jgi:ferredoxin, 2Fe-2S
MTKPNTPQHADQTMLAPSAETVTVSFIQDNGQKIDVHASVGLSLLEVARQYGINLEGACEGSLACSTCHVVVDPSWYESLDTASEDEEDMLDLAFGLTQTSRLGCQIFLTKKLDGLVVTVPPQTRNLAFASSAPTPKA